MTSEFASIDNTALNKRHDKRAATAGGMSMSKPNITLSLSKLERDNPCTQHTSPTEPHQQPGLRGLVKAWSLLQASGLPGAGPRCALHIKTLLTAALGRGSWEADGGRRSCQSSPDSLRLYFVFEFHRV